MSMVYSHRNGESDLPAVEGTYWFNGKVYYRGYVAEVASLREVMAHRRREGYEHWLIVAEESEDLLKDAEGRWWGPLIPPWEAE